MLRERAKPAWRAADEARAPSAEPDQDFVAKRIPNGCQELIPRDARPGCRHRHGPVRRSSREGQELAFLRCANR